MPPLEYRDFDVVIESEGSLPSSKDHTVRGMLRLNSRPVQSGELPARTTAMRGTSKRPLQHTGSRFPLLLSPAAMPLKRGGRGNRRGAASAAKGTQAGGGPSALQRESWVPTGAGQPQRANSGKGSAPSNSNARLEPEIRSRTGTGPAKLSRSAGL